MPFIYTNSNSNKNKSIIRITSKTERMEKKKIFLGAKPKSSSL